MVLKIFKRKPRDPYLSQTISTERFDLSLCSWPEAVQLTLPWANDPETLHAFRYSSTSYSRLLWALRMPIPNGRNFFVHAVREKSGNKVVGMHLMRLTPSGSLSLMMGLTDKSWEGKGVFEEVRSALFDHFSRSPKVVRFAGRVLARNTSSVYIYQKLGFRFVGYEKMTWRSPLTGELMDLFFFELLAEDWRDKRGLMPI